MESFRELLGKICLRPQMYVARREFTLVAAFLTGYEYAQGNPDPELTQFGRWLVARFGYPSNFFWHRNLLDHCGGDGAVALQRLPELYDEFVAQRPPARKRRPAARAAKRPAGGGSPGMG